MVKFKAKFWEIMWVAVPISWGMFALMWFLSFVIPKGGQDAQPVGPTWALILWIVVPIFWIGCVGFGITPYYEYELGYREYTLPDGSRVENDTTPTKRVILMWLGPLSLCYFIVRSKWLKHSTNTPR